MIVLVSLIANPITKYVIAVAAGFAVGRIKNAGKLAAVKAELDVVELGTVHTVESLYLAIKKHV